MGAALGIISGLSDFLLKTWIGRALSIMMMLTVALWAYTKHVEKGATQKVVAQVTQATTTETDRRGVVLQQAQDEMKKPIADLLAASKRNEDLLKEIERASHANDGRACLDAAAVGRLRAIQ